MCPRTIHFRVLDKSGPPSCNTSSLASTVYELLDVQAGFRKGRGTRDQIANIHWIVEKPREFQKDIYFCFIDYAKEMGILGHLTCLLRNLIADLALHGPKWLHFTMTPVSVEDTLSIVILFDHQAPE